MTVGYEKCVEMASGILSARAWTPKGRANAIAEAQAWATLAVALRPHEGGDR